MKLIEVTVSPVGESKVETKGFAGGECREASRFLERALGVRAAEVMTAEYYRAQEAHQDLRQSQ
jgi:hypothetical protein